MLLSNGSYAGYGTGTDGKELVIDANGDTGKSAIGAGKNASGGTVNKWNYSRWSGRKWKCLWKGNHNG
ncbi:hypothetical protein [[Clostridium] polysaccharolyticum]|uniref:hypothetical protein n=1 Tax=[Clostridium] polysaccharolyticum TaxID=29364 RepID=UPI000B864772|nr:hypothetical protein [[Clostridium] polysaccharolyticum]